MSSEANLWKVVERMEQIVDHIEEINEYLDTVHEHEKAFNQWIDVATQSILAIQKDINFLKTKKTCI